MENYGKENHKKHWRLRYNVGNVDEHLSRLVTDLNNFYNPQLRCLMSINSLKTVVKHSRYIVSMFIDTHSFKSLLHLWIEVLSDTSLFSSAYY